METFIIIISFLLIVAWVFTYNAYRRQKIETNYYKANYEQLKAKQANEKSKS